MIKPVSIGLRILAILGAALLQILTAPLSAVGKVLSILANEVLLPVTAQVQRLESELERNI